ncbi:hypothetical protein HDV05_004009 [Chytridiales sp. JEL 0842]|nr:hypothetical protein HDV05_004009 [Chytridiales sp. JEL 0842]
MTSSSSSLARDSVASTSSLLPSPTSQQPSSKPFPVRQVALLLLTVLPEVLIHHMLGPLYPFMVRSLIPGEEKVGYYAGLLQSAYFLPTIVGAPLMGHLSDKYGRKPILLAGLVGYAIGTLLLGLSTAYWAALVSLFVTGCFAGNTVVAKGMIGELGTDDKMRAIGYSVYGVVFGGAGILGSFMGGFLADPKLFANIPFLEERPYLLACLVGFLIALVGIITTLNTLAESGTSGKEMHPFVKFEEVDMEDDAAGLVYERRMMGLSNGGGVEMDELNQEESIRKRISHDGGDRPVLFNHSATDLQSPEIDLESEDASSIRTLRNSSTPPIYPPPPSQTTYKPSSMFEDPSDTFPKPSSPTRRPSTFSRQLQTLLNPYLSILRSRCSLIPILLYTTFALTQSIFHTALPLLASAPFEKGGYNLGPSLTALSMTTGSLCKLIIKAFFLPIQTLLGTLGGLRTGALSSLPSLILIPFRLGSSSSVIPPPPAATTAAAAAAASVAVLVTSVPYWPLYVFTGLVGLGEGLTYLCVIMIMTDSVPATQYGLVHGVGGCLASIVRTLGPAMAGALWEFAGKGWVFGVMVGLVGVMVGISFLLEGKKGAKTGGGGMEEGVGGHDC